MSGTISAAVVVLDAAAPLGRAVASAALDAGRHVIAVSPDASVPVDLAARHRRRLSYVAGGVDNETQARRLAEQLRAQRRPLAAIVAGFHATALRGCLLAQSAETTCSELGKAIAPQLAAARHLLPLLAERDRTGTLLMIGGPGSRQPWAGYGQRSLNEAALRMLARVLHGEARAIGVRLQLLSVERPAWGMDDMLPRADWPSVLDVGQRAIALLDATAPVDAIVGYDAPHVPLAMAATQYADAGTRTPRPRAARARTLRRAALGEVAS
jgi:NADP-dependent 3-hydroxy acid dehydrogenase YdfG